MKVSFLKYVFKVMLLVEKDGNTHFCGDYCPLNTQTHMDVYPMPLIDDVLSQMGVVELFITLDLQSGFQQIKMTLMM